MAVVQYLVNRRLPDDLMIVEKGRPCVNPKYLAKSLEEHLAETQEIVDAITQRFPTVTVLNVTPIFAVIDTTEEIAAAIRAALDYVAVDPNRHLHL